MKNTLITLGFLGLTSCMTPKTSQQPVSKAPTYITVDGVIIQDDPKHERKRLLRQLAPEFREKLVENKDTILQLMNGERVDLTSIAPGFSEKELSHIDSVISENTQKENLLYMHTTNGSTHKRGDFQKDDNTKKFTENDLFFKEEEVGNIFTREIVRPGGSYFRSWPLDRGGSPPIQRGHAEPFVW